jgi:hypothetical protein
MLEIDEFYNNGFGWICRRCENDLKTQNENANQNLPRVWREGEAESNRPKLAAPLAKWLDAAKTQLICPHCGIAEVVNKA